MNGQSIPIQCPVCQKPTNFWLSSGSLASLRGALATAPPALAIGNLRHTRCGAILEITVGDLLGRGIAESRISVVS